MKDSAPPGPTISLRLLSLLGFALDVVDFLLKCRHSCAEHRTSALAPLEQHFVREVPVDIFYRLPSANCSLVLQQLLQQPLLRL